MFVWVVYWGLSATTFTAFRWFYSFRRVDTGGGSRDIMLTIYILYFITGELAAAGASLTYNRSVYSFRSSEVWRLHEKILWKSPTMMRGEESDWWGETEAFNKTRTSSFWCRRTWWTRGWREEGSDQQHQPGVNITHQNIFYILVAFNWSVPHPLFFTHHILRPSLILFPNSGHISWNMSRTRPG